MTKEELEKEARQKALEWDQKKINGKYNRPPIAHWSCYEKGYIAGAEPREKRIADLEAQEKKMKCLLEKWYNQHSDKTYTKTFYDELIKATEAFLWSDVCVK